MLIVIEDEICHSVVSGLPSCHRATLSSVMMAVQGDSSAGELLRKDVVNFLRLLVRTEALCESGVAVDGVRDFQKRIEV